MACSRSRGRLVTNRQIAVLQALIVQFGGEAFSTHPLSWQQWGACMGIGALSLIVRELLLLIRVPDKEVAADSRNQ